jgi:hypothetical protein
MQKVVGSSPIIRSQESPAPAGFFVASVETGSASSVSLVPVCARKRRCPAAVNRRVEFVDEQLRVLVVAPDDLLNLPKIAVRENVAAPATPDE